MSDESGAPQAGRRDWLALTGLIFVVLLVAAFVLIASVPSVRDAPQTFAAFYSSPAHIAPILAATYLVPIAGIMFLWFLGVLRGLFAPIQEGSQRFNWTIATGGSILFLACLFVATGAVAAPAASIAYLGAAPPNPDSAVPLTELGSIVLFVFGMRAAAAFMIFTSRLGQETHSLPTWLAIMGIVFGVVLLFFITYAPFFLLLLPVWVAALSIYMLLRPPVRAQPGPPR